MDTGHLARFSEGQLIATGALGRCARPLGGALVHAAISCLCPSPASQVWGGQSQPLLRLRSAGRMSVRSTHVTKTLVSRPHSVDTTSTQVTQAAVLTMATGCQARDMGAAGAP